MADLTVIYYSDNKENPDFEAKIQRTMLETIGDLPLISVSHKPMDLGVNICVGEMSANAHNMWRQFQVGAREAKTAFVCPHEADFLRPRCFYEYQPQREDVFYIANPLYLLLAYRGRRASYRLKRGAENSMIIGRTYIINIIEKMLQGRGTWEAEDAEPLNDVLWKYGERVDFQLPIPIITFKTGHGMHLSSPSARQSVTELPYWGNAVDLTRKYV